MACFDRTLSRSLSAFLTKLMILFMLTFVEVEVVLIGGDDIVLLIESNEEEEEADEETT